MSSSSEFGVFTPGKKASATALTNHASRLKELTPLLPGNSIQVLTTPNGTVVGLHPEEASRTHLVLVKITSTISGQAGRYNAKVFRGIPKVNATGNFVEGDLGVLSSANDAIVWFTPDVGTGTHSLEAGAIIMAKVVEKNSAGLLVVQGIGGGGGGGESVGQYQYTVHMMVADNVGGWDFPQAHDLL